MTRVKRLLVRLVIAPIVLVSTLFIAPSPAFAGCQSGAFTFYWNNGGANYQISCSGTYTNLSIFTKVTKIATGPWGGYIVADSQTKYFCDGEVYSYVHYRITKLYLASMRPSWC